MELGYHGKQTAFKVRTTLTGKNLLIHVIEEKFFALRVGPSQTDLYIVSLSSKTYVLKTN